MSEGGVAKSEARRSAEVEGAAAAKAAPACTPARAAVLLVVLGVVAAVVVDAFTGKHVEGWLDDFLDWMKDAGALGALAFAGVYVLATVCFAPGSVLTLGAGFVFAQAYSSTAVGIALGSAVVFVGAATGATIAFLLARYSLREVVAARARKYKLLRAVDAAVAAQGFKTILLLRLSPVIPFNALNYCLGITGVSLPAFVLGSVGMLPGTVAYVYLGSLLSDVRQAAQGKAQEDPALKWTLLSVGIVAAIAAVVFVSRLARKELKKMAVDADAESKPPSPPDVRSTRSPLLAE